MSVFIVKKEDCSGLEDTIIYSGKYDIDKSKITHHIEVSPRKVRNNTSELRFYELQGNTLTLKTTTKLGHEYEIIWTK